MDFVSKNFLEKEDNSEKDLRIFFDIYQQLGLAWEFLSLECKHREGYKKTTDPGTNHFKIEKRNRNGLNLKFMPNGR